MSTLKRIPPPVVYTRPRRLRDFCGSIGVTRSDARLV